MFIIFGACLALKMVFGNLKKKLFIIFTFASFFGSCAIVHLITDNVNMFLGFNMHWQLKKVCDLLKGDIRFTVVIWDLTCHISEVCLYTRLMVMTCVVNHDALCRARYEEVVEDPKSCAAIKNVDRWLI